MGFMLIAISIGTELIIYWLLFYMFIHALIKALLFFSAGILHRQYRSNEVDTMFDTLRLQPIASIGLTVGSISILGIPPFGMFLPKFMILTQIILYSDLLLLIGVLFFFVIAISSFAKFDTKLFSNFLVHEFDSIRKYESSLLMKLPILILTLLIFIIGIFIPLEIQNFISSIVKIIIL
jgi:hydrogenase-4 component F